MIDTNIKWPKLWDSLCTNGRSFEGELYKESGKKSYIA